MSLSPKDADNFIVNHLKLPTWKSFKENPVQLLKAIVKQYVVHIYFQNVDLASIPIGSRQVPKVEEVIENSLEGRGGNCITLNYFMKLLLQAIGFDAYTISGNINNPDNHVMTVVRILEPEEKKYVIDVGSANPLWEPVPLDSLPWKKPVIGFSYEFRQVDENEFHRVQIDGGYFYGEYIGEKKELIRIVFSLIPREYSHFLSAMELVWKDEENSVFCKNLFLFRHIYLDKNNEPIRDSSDETNFALNPEIKPKFILVFGPNFLIGSETERIEVIKSSGYDENLISKVLKYFPKINETRLRSAISILSQVIPYDPRE